MSDKLLVKCRIARSFGFDDFRGALKDRKFALGKVFHFDENLEGTQFAIQHIKAIAMLVADARPRPAVACLGAAQMAHDSRISRIAVAATDNDAIAGELVVDNESKRLELHKWKGLMVWERWRLVTLRRID